MNKEDYIEKLTQFKIEIESCDSKDNFLRIEERLKRKLLEIYLMDDPFIKKCKSSWKLTQSQLASLSSIL